MAGGRWETTRKSSWEVEEEFTEEQCLIGKVNCVGPKEAVRSP